MLYRPVVLVRVAASVLATLVVVAVSVSDTLAERPSVLFLAVDDLRPEIGCYGSAKMLTPSIDRLAGRGVRFDRAYCNIAVCGASRASLMSGLRPTPTRFTRHDTQVSVDAAGVPTLPATFKAAGYHTVTNGKVYHQKRDDADAWSEPDWREGGPGSWWALEENRAMVSPTTRGPAYESADKPVSSYPDFRTATKTIEDLRRLSAGEKPFFIASGFYKPHLPFVTPQEFWSLYPSDAIQLPDNMFFPRNLDRAFRYNWGELRKYDAVPSKGPLSTDAARNMLRGYYACVSFTDAQIGRVIDALDQLDLAESTIVVLWGDHGWQLGEHGFWCKHTNFEVATRVPLVIVAPGVDGARATTRLVETVDLYPTLCELAGLPEPEHLQGRSLLPLLEDTEARHKDAVYTRYGGGDAVRTERFRYVEQRDRRGVGKLQATALFDLQLDPGENDNVVQQPEYAEAVLRLRDQLARARQSATAGGADWP
ncbi:MAG: sulfatase [Planctomycetota bacterium]